MTRVDELIGMSAGGSWAVNCCDGSSLTGSASAASASAGCTSGACSTDSSDAAAAGAVASAGGAACRWWKMLVTELNATVKGDWWCSGVVSRAEPESSADDRLGRGAGVASARTVVLAAGGALSEGAG